jgi:hypothetical protein
MRAMSLLVAVILMFSALPVVSADMVDVIQCGSELIEVGDPVSKVLDNCGEPSYTVGSKWFYNRGPTKYDAVIYFDGDQVSDLEELPTKSPPPQRK